MRELVLVLPDLFLHAGENPLSASAALSLRFDAPRRIRGGWRGLLARGAGREDLALIDEASVIDATLRASVAGLSQSIAAPEPLPEAWLATPLHLQAGLKTLHFPPHGLLRLRPDEAQQLAQEFARVFGADGLELVPAGSAGFVLRGLAAAGVLTVDPARLIGGPLEESLPAGAGSAQLRALASEIEMWLHEAPLNRTRAERGEPTVSTLWLWGGGQPPRDPIVRQPRGPGARWDRLFGEDAWTQALAQLAGLPFGGTMSNWAALRAADRTAGERDECWCVVLPLADRGLETLEREFLAPLVRELHDGRVGALVIAANDRWTRLAASDRYRFWRPRRSLLEAVADAAV